MKFLPSAAVLTAFGSLAGAAAVAAHLVRLPDLGDLRRDLRTLADSAARRERLDRALDGAARHAAAKARVTADVIAARLTLAEAAERFARLDAERQEQVGPLGASHTLPAGREAAWGNVITWVKARLGDAPDEAADVVSRLEAEYRDYFGHAPPMCPLLPQPG